LIHPAIIDEIVTAAIERRRSKLPDGTNYDNTPAAYAVTVLRDCKADVKALTWLDLLAAEFAQAAAEQDRKNLRKHLVKLSAVCIAWIEAIDEKR
jgi:hypothetical protein